MKWRIILVIMMGFLIGISSGGFVNDPIRENDPNWKGFTIDEWQYEICPFGCSAVLFNLSEYLYPPITPVIVEEPESVLEPIPLITISKEDLFASLATGSASNQSLVSLLQSGFYFG